MKPSRPSSTPPSSPVSPPAPAPAAEPGSPARDRGREAVAPSQVPAAGWKDILWRTSRQIGADNLSIVAGGVAFFAFVAVVPALAATIALWALLAEPATLASALEGLARVMPAEVMPLLHEQITRLAADNQAAGWSAVLGLGVALFSSMKATKALIAGLNIAYDEAERRGFLRLQAVAFVLTLAGVVGAVLVTAVVTVLPALLGRLGLGTAAEQALAWGRWPALGVLFVAGLAVLYRFAPCRDGAQWRWVTWGAGVAAGLWLAGSAGFSFYVSRFAGYEQTYGSLGAVVIFLLWLYLTALVILLGAELNAEMERQTLHDTTTGPSAPLGRRGAHAADTVGEAKR